MSTLTIDFTKRQDNIAKRTDALAYVPAVFRKFRSQILTQTKRVFRNDKRVTFVGIGFLPGRSATNEMHAIYYTCNDSYTDQSNIFAFPITIEQETITLVEVNNDTGIATDAKGNTYDFSGGDNGYIYWNDTSNYIGNEKHAQKAVDGDHIEINENIIVLKNNTWTTIN